MSDMYKIYDAAARYYNWVLCKGKSKAADVARSYLNKRNINTPDAENWNLGFASTTNGLSKFLLDCNFSYEEMYEANLVYKNQKTGQCNDRFYNRVMFPISDEKGRVCGFGGRALKEDNPAKYLNTAKTAIFDKSNLLYGLEKVTQENLKNNDNDIYVVEGYTDVIAMHKCGFSSTVATLGTALTDKHLQHFEKIKPNRVILMFDGDSAGQKALDRALTYIKQIVGNLDIDFVGLTLPDNLDPKEFLDKNGQNAMKEEIYKARDIVEIKIDNIFKEHDLNLFGESAKAAQRCCALLALVDDFNKCQKYCNYIANKLDFGTTNSRAVIIEKELMRQIDLLNKKSNFKNQWNDEIKTDDRNAIASELSSSEHESGKTRDER